MSVNSALMLYLVFIIAVLVSGKFRASVVFTIAIIPFFLFGKISETSLFDAFFNTSVLSIFALIILSNIIYKEFLFFQTIEQQLIRIKTKTGFNFILHAVVMSISAFINNTPVVSSFIPILRNLNKKTSFTSSFSLISLNHAALLGGTLTLIGTSTHLVMNGLLQSEGFSGLHSIQFFHAAWPAALAGFIYLLIFNFFNTDKIRFSPISSDNKTPVFTFDLKVTQQSSLAGKTIELANLRQLENFYLFQIVRKNQTIEATPEIVIETGDRLMFTGNRKQVQTLLDLFPGLEQEGFSNEIRKEDIVEAVILNDSYLHNKSLKSMQFREKFGAVVLALSKNNQEITTKLGTGILHAGDILLMKLTDSSKFYEMSPGNLLIVSKEKIHKPVYSGNKTLFIGLLAIVMLLAILQLIPVFIGLTVLVFSSILLRLTNQFELKKLVNLDLWLMIGSSIALSEAMLNSFNFNEIRADFMPVAQFYSTEIILFAVLFVTALLTNFLSNVATVSVLFPFVSLLAKIYPQLSEALFLALALGASGSFFTHYGYQTNAMIFYSGNYLPKDFFNIGFPLWLIYIVFTFISLNFLYV